MSYMKTIVARVMGLVVLIAPIHGQGPGKSALASETASAHADTLRDDIPIAVPFQDAQELQ